ncbi:MAG TPA: glycine zipper 2TM domain-containing protein [Allosphingosinicella sp.]
MKKIIFGLVAASVALPTAAAAQPGFYDPYRGGGYSHPYDRNGDGVVTQREIRRTQREERRYNNGYYPQAYPQSYSGGYAQFHDRSGFYNGPTWRGNDGRYYCRRSDGSTGTIVGAATGALIGSQVAGRGDRTLGAVLGGALGALIGSRADSGNRVRCY